mgnify:CR=1 FL=1
MKENENINENTEQQMENIYTPKYTKQQSALYTIISIALFCVIYFGGKGIISMINRPYYTYRTFENSSEELVSMQYEFANISQEYELEYLYSELERDESRYKVSILFSGFDDIESFAEKSILFEYGNAVEDVDNEFHPYTDNMNSKEYVVSTKYVDIDNPNNEILVFEYENKLYAEFQNYGSLVPTEVKILFDGCEKVY